MKYLFLLLIPLSLFANDGVYYGNGGMIYPMQETSIAMEKEILSFTCREGRAQVDILFEFNNPEPTERSLLIGFQAPAPSGDLSEEFKGKLLIENFQVMQNGQILPYEIKGAECEDCEVQSLSNFDLNRFESGIYVYLFEVTFAPGKNILKHSYDFPASGGVVMDESYEYILTTGAKWAGEQIKDFTLQIDLGKNQYFYLMDIFGEQAEWEVIGVGKVTDEIYKLNSEPRRMVRILSGKLQVTVKNFQPKENLHFAIINKESFINFYLEEGKTSDRIFMALRRLNLEIDFGEEGPFTKEELRILRNAIYAQHGYAFKSKDLQEYFNRFTWYVPDPNLRLEDIKLSEKEKQFVREIVRLENG